MNQVNSQEKFFKNATFKEVALIVALFLGIGVCVALAICTEPTAKQKAFVSCVNDLIKASSSDAIITQNDTVITPNIPFSKKVDAFENMCVTDSPIHYSGVINLAKAD